LGSPIVTPASVSGIKDRKAFGYSLNYLREIH
jgi:hypothetical protein